MNQKNMYIIFNNLNIRYDPFAKSIFAGKITLNDADKDQSDLLIQIVEFIKTQNQKTYRKKTKKRYL